MSYNDSYVSRSNPRPSAKLRVELGGKPFTVEVPDTVDRGPYKTIDAGKIVFPNAERTTLRVSVADKADWSPPNIRFVKLVPTNG